MSMAALIAIPGKVKTLLDRVTQIRADNLDRLDATVSSRASSTEVAKAATWSNALALLITTNLDQKVSSAGTIKKSVVLTSTSAANWTIPSKIKGSCVLVSAIGGGATGERTGIAGSATGGGSGAYIQKALYTFSGAEITAGQIAYQCGVGGAARTTNGANDGSPTSFGVWSLAGGKGNGGKSGAAGGAVLTSQSMYMRACSPPGPFGASAGAGGSSSAGGAGGLRFNALSPIGTDNVGDGYGAGTSGSTSTGVNTAAGIQGAILLEWEESP